MSDFWLGALFTAVVSAVAVPLINHYLAKRREHQSAVLISIRANTFVLPNTLESIFKPPSLLDTSPNQSAQIAPDDQLRILGRMKSYIRVTLLNNTHRKIT